MLKKLTLTLAGVVVLTTASEAQSVTLEFDRAIGEPGFEPGQLFVPQGIGVQLETGDVFVANGRGFIPPDPTDPEDQGEFLPFVGNRVDVFSNDGEYLRAVGVGSQEPGAGFDEPADLKFDPLTGNMYVGDVFNSEVDIYDPNTGEYIDSFASFSGPQPGDIFFGPGGADFDAEGNYYITDFSADVINVYGRDNELINVLGEPGSEPGQFDGPAGIVVSPNTGRLYVNDQFNNRIQVLETDGTPIFEFGTEGTEPGQFNEPIGIDIDEFENIYVADSQNNRVQVFDSEGNLLTVFGEPVADFGPPGPGELPFSVNPADLEPGLFNWSGGLTYINGEDLGREQDEVYVGDFFTGRVQVLNVEGNEPGGAVQQETVPEPSSVLGLTLLGLGAAGATRRKRQQAVSR